MKRLAPLAVVVFLTSAAVLPALAVTPLSINMSSNKITQTGQIVGFDLANPGHEAAVTRIFTMQGQEIGELTAQSMGHYSWDGDDVDRQPVASGLYVVQISHHGEVWHGPVVVNR